jgi:mannose-1-phosphate guanylyltransferase
LIEETVARLDGLCSPKEILVVTAAEPAEAVISYLDRIPRRNILIEPVGKNTAPCIGVAALYIQKRDPEGVMAVLPADHVIRGGEKFQRVLRAGAELAKKEQCLITMGIEPRCPETGYGYIVRAEEAARVDGVASYKVSRFVEKPVREKARKLLDTKKAFWNSGMFLWKASVILAEIAAYLPDLYSLLMELEPYIGTEKEEEIFNAIYARAEPVSIDYGIMEKSQKVCVLPADFYWSDMGSFSALDETFQPDDSGNILVGKDHLVLDARNMTVYSPGKPVALVGVDNLIVVETEDALLVCRKDRAQDVKKIVQLLEEGGCSRLL